MTANETIKHQLTETELTEETEGQRRLKTQIACNKASFLKDKHEIHVLNKRYKRYIVIGAIICILIIIIVSLAIYYGVIIKENYTCTTMTIMDYINSDSSYHDVHSKQIGLELQYHTSFNTQTCYFFNVLSMLCMCDDERINCPCDFNYLTEQGENQLNRTFPIGSNIIGCYKSDIPDLCYFESSSKTNEKQTNTQAMFIFGGVTIGIIIVFIMIYVWRISCIVNVFLQRAQDELDKIAKIEQGMKVLTIPKAHRTSRSKKRQVPGTAAILPQYDEKV